ncbi:hypothetical protein BU25DRAFT_17657 [Macroventuria anomochaeta]|uniref:Uncharacterized protein n=1 Tax=Macroventuria anomochaeta TaxID=301207 RepID=A0ACB6SI80_9PLEO|nr:uncharacterized protein BU25DRAFT_17657 [Macroventuria anomochaeta]KAF2634005.1 hypothetical protein BU25DRAFT_17657 [Macroventuria anomochaeta]
MTMPTAGAESAGTAETAGGAAAAAVVPLVLRRCAPPGLFFFGSGPGASRCVPLYQARPSHPSRHPPRQVRGLSSYSCSTDSLLGRLNLLTIMEVPLLLGEDWHLGDVIVLGIRRRLIVGSRSYGNLVIIIRLVDGFLSFILWRCSRRVGVLGRGGSSSTFTGRSTMCLGTCFLLASEDGLVREVFKTRRCLIIDPRCHKVVIYIA